MSRGTWNIQIKSGGVWGAVSTIYRPNDNFNTVKMATQVKIKLADGSNAFVSPSTKYTQEPFGFIWYWDDGTVKALIDGYVTGGSDLKITDDLGNILYGRFVSFEATRYKGQDNAKYDVKATFENMPTIA